jgi:hypothetical protein
MIVADGHGGTLLIVPGQSHSWLNSLDPFDCRFAHPDTTVRDALRLQLNDTHAQGKALEQIWTADLPDDLKSLVSSAVRPVFAQIGKSLREIASLAAVDGAVVLTRDFQLVGFGAKIVLRDHSAPRVSMFRSVSGSQKVVPSPLEDLGGTRHQSAARFAGANRDSLALVISQDRHLSIMHWDNSIGAVAVIRNAEWWV